MKIRIETRILLMGIIILQVVMLIYGGWGCGNTEEKKPEKAGESVFTLPKDALGTFSGEESGYHFGEGRKKVFVPSSRWLLKLNDASIYLRQSGEASTYYYEGPFLVEVEDDTSLIITARLSEKRTQTVYTPKLRFNKNQNIWLLESSNDDHVVTLIRK